MAKGPDDDEPVASGPIALPADLRRPSPWRGWLVAFGIVLLILVIYGVSRPPAVGSLPVQPAPTWGRLTLAGIAKTEAKAAGDPHPKSAVWLEAPLFKALPVLSGQQSGSAVTQFVVSLDGTFRAPTTWTLLPGSQTGGAVLTILVRGFDGTVTGRLITSHAPALGRLGRTYRLRLGFL